MKINQRYRRIKQRGYSYGEEPAFWFFSGQASNGCGIAVERVRDARRLLEKRGSWVIGGNTAKEPGRGPFDSVIMS